MSAQNQEEYINASEVARIWNRRAREEHGVESHYSRMSVPSRAKDLDVQDTPLGRVYSRKRAEEIPLRPRNVQRPDLARLNVTQNKERRKAKKKQFPS